MNRIKEILEKKRIKQTWFEEKIIKNFHQTTPYIYNHRQPSLEQLFEKEQDSLRRFRQIFWSSLIEAK